MFLVQQLLMTASDTSVVRSVAAGCFMSPKRHSCTMCAHLKSFCTNHHESSQIITNPDAIPCHTMPYHAIPCRTQPLQVVCSNHVQHPGQPRAQWSLLVPISPTISILNTVMHGCNPNICSVAVEPT